MKRLVPLFVAAALLAIPLQEAQAQTGVGFGPELYYNAEIEEFGLGARVQVTPPMFPVGFLVNGIYVFQDCGEFDCTVLEFGASGKYTLSLPGSPLGPYFGAGLTHQRFSSDDLGDEDDTGFHILGGLGLGGMLPIGAFVEARYLIMDANQFTVSLGILF